MPKAKSLQQLDLNLLKVFECLYREQNMTRCATLLHLTPSAVSHAVKRLRDALQDELFVRSGSKMLPTSACAGMAPALLDNLARLRQILQQLGHFDASQTTRHYRIGLHYAQEASILSPLMTGINQLAPNATLSSVHVNRHSLQQELGAGHLDAVIDVALPIKSPVLHKKLMTDNFAILANQQHYPDETITKAQYIGGRHIAVSNRPTGMVIEDIGLSQLGVNRDIALRCQHYATARDIVSQSDLLLTLPARLATELIQSGLHLLDLPYPLAPMDIHLYWHSHTEHDPAQIWFRQQITQVIRI
ncbi:LysR family transcriptional regulator [Neptunicella sp. SCSIO 80796]|uniref:LysR family transcriptional regulator n=1 Tax=Neptunicella plasticusilytica TaxID=3117012 RepID=UPI003A4D6D77